MKRKNQLRRKKVQKKPRLSAQFIRKLLPYSFIIVVLSVGLMIFKDVKFKTVLPIKQVKVEGALHHVDSAQIKIAVLKNIEGGYFTLNLVRLRKQLMMNAWIERVSIRRHWPAQLIVNVVEKEAVAYWNNNAFISAEGKVFKPQNRPATLLLPHMYGPEGQAKKVWLFMNKIYQPLAGLALEVDGLYLDNRRAWKLVLNDMIDEKMTDKKTNADVQASLNTVTVRLGRYDTDAHFKRFIDVFSRINSPDLAQIKFVDMRYPNGFAILKKTFSNKKNKITQSDSLKNTLASFVGTTGQSARLTRQLNSMPGLHQLRVELMQADTGTEV